MKERPILFQTDMVRAILEGRKTQTRRIVKPQPDENGLTDWFHHRPHIDFEDWGWFGNDANNAERKWLCPYGKEGDVFWVKETWCEVEESMDTLYLYKADKHPLPNGCRWKSALFMPKAAARIWLEITDVRVERSQDITEEDAVAEGIDCVDTLHPNQPVWKNYLSNNVYNSAVNSFSSLWESIHGADSWQANPYVWVITFKRIRK